MPARHRVPEPTLHLDEPVAVVDRDEDRSRPPAGAPGSRARRFSARVRTSPGPSGRAISGSKSDTSCSTVIAGKVPGSTSCGTRSRISSEVATIGPARGRPGGDDADPDDEHSRHDQSDPHGAAQDTDPGVGRPSRAGVANRPISSAVDRGSGTSRSRIGRAAHTSTRPESSPTFVPNSLVCGASSRVLATATRKPNIDSPDTSGRRGLGVGDHEEQEDQHLGRGDDHSPEVESADRLERPVRGHAVPGAGEQPDPDRQRNPERRSQGEQVQPSGDQQPAADDHDVGGDHPDVQRRPPEIERLDDACSRARRRPRPARCWTG